MKKNKKKTVAVKKKKKIKYLKVPSFKSREDMEHFIIDERNPPVINPNKT